MDNHYDGFLYAANNDVKAIEALCNQGLNEHSEVIAFHAQQAAEKMIKNVFTTNGQIPPKTHAIDELMEYAISQGWLDKEAAAFNEAAASLTQYSVMARYAQSSDITGSDALKAISNCNSISKILESNKYEALTINIDI